MRKMIFAYYLMVVLLFSTTAILTAESMDFNAGSIQLVAEEEDSSVIETEDFEGDYFWGGYRINFNGSAEDLYLMGRNIEFDGSSSGFLTAFGDTIRVDGVVSNNLHTAGNDVRINGTVADTAFVAGQDVTIADGSVIEGTLFSGSNTLHILGELKNGLYAGAGEIIIDGPVEGDVNVRVGKLIITERGSIDGNLTYGANTLISAEEESRVSGWVTVEETDDIDTEAISTFCIVAGILFFAGLVISGLLLLLLPIFRDAVSVDRDPRSYGKMALWGLIPLFIYPVAIIVSIPLLPLSLALLLAGFPFWLLTLILGLTLSGQLLFKVFKWEKDNRFLHFLLGFGIFTALSFVPYLDFLVGLAVAALGAGLLISNIFKTEFK